MIEKMIVDADLCIKLGSSDKYKFLYDLLPIIAKNIYMHTWTYGEVRMPYSAVKQLKDLVRAGKVELVNESNLNTMDRAVFDASYRNLEQVMINPQKPNKNKGETLSLAYAKAMNIPFFATDEKHLQPIIDSRLNTGINDITCIRITDIIQMVRDGEINLPRKTCKALWIIAGKDKAFFDSDIWPLNN